LATGPNGCIRMRDEGGPRSKVRAGSPSWDKPGPHRRGCPPSGWSCRVPPRVEQMYLAVTGYLSKEEETSSKISRSRRSDEGRCFFLRCYRNPETMDVHYAHTGEEATGTQYIHPITRFPSIIVIGGQSIILTTLNATDPPQQELKQGDPEVPRLPLRGLTRPIHHNKD